MADDDRKSGAPRTGSRKLENAFRVLFRRRARRSEDAEAILAAGAVDRAVSAAGALLSDERSPAAVTDPLRDGNLEAAEHALADICDGADERNRAAMARTQAVFAASRSVADGDDAYRRLADIDPGNVAARLDHARLHRAAGNHDRALEILDAALPQAAAPGDEAAVLAELATVHAVNGDLDAALESHWRSHQIVEALAEAARGDRDARRDLSRSLMALGRLLVKKADRGGALDCYRAAADALAGLAAAEDADTADLRGLGLVHALIGDILMAQQDYAAAADSYRTALAAQERLSETAPRNTTFHCLMAGAHDSLADALAAAGDTAAAVAELGKSLAIVSGLSTEFPETERYRGLAADTEAKIEALRSDG